MVISRFYNRSTIHIRRPIVNLIIDCHARLVQCSMYGKSEKEEVMMRLFLVCIGIMVMVATVHAATFEWTDSQGGIHFTDDPDRIPDKYRGQARELYPQPASGEKDHPPAQQPPPAVASTPDVPRGASLFGGHDE